MELTEKEAHCVARLLQGAIYGGGGHCFGNPFDGCFFCKYNCETATGKEVDGSPLMTYPVYDKLLTRLTEETGLMCQE